MKFQKIRGIRHYVFYTVDEFESYFRSRDLKIPALNVDWKSAKQGEWVMADDGGIVQILKRGVSKNNNEGWVRTIVGTFKQNKYYEMDTDFTLHPDRYTFSGKPRDRMKEITERETPTNKEIKFVLNLVRGMTIRDAYIDAFGLVKGWKYRAHTLLKQDRIMSEIRNQSKEAATELGLNVKFIMSSLMELTGRDIMDNVRLAALKELREWLEAMETESNQSYAIEQSPLEAIDMGRIEKDKLEVFNESE